MRPRTVNTASAFRRRQREKLRARHGHRCCWCRVSLRRQDETIEHVIPRWRGGTNDLANLRIACGPCNNARAQLERMNGGSFPHDLVALVDELGVRVASHLAWQNPRRYNPGSDPRCWVSRAFRKAIRP